MIGNVILIAEVKTESPSGWKSERSWDDLFAIANKHGDMISIHTDPRWGGSIELVARARGMTRKLILAKGIHATDDLVAEAFYAGADYVLVVGRVPAIQPQHCLIEPHTVAELRELPPTTLAVWNSRNLHLLYQTDNRKSETFAQARSVFPGWLCQASNLTTIQDIKPGANAVLVGTKLLEFVESIKNFQPRHSLV
ncbi:MAG: hypothetical protein UX68_C0006G0035 [Parcubacteria group bacterium GW2011_GWA2_46_9]|nr:MAG: hypothetical protein UX68_C0006G0035 [Parcubacteria group bacterium GW2011_GWA2_46_9]